MEDRLTEAAVERALSTKWLGRPYCYLESAGSTNDLLKTRVAVGKADDPAAGTVILADYQETGRGRFDRSWEAPPATSLLFSVLFRPNWVPVRLSWLTMLAGLSAAEAIEKAMDLPVFLKWPNDVVIRYRGEWSKICGILLEGVLSATQALEYAVLGLGINVNIPAADLPDAVQPAASLMAVAGRRFSRLALLVELLAILEHRYEAADRGESPQRSWNDRLITLGHRVEVQHMGQGRIVSGMAEGTNEWGHLLVRDDQGHLHTITAADVTLRGAK